MPGKQDRMPGIAWLAGVLVCLLLAACATKNTSTRAPPNNGRSEKQAQSEGARKTKPPSQRKKLVAQARTAAGQSNWAGAIAARVHLGRVLNRWDRRAENQKKLWHALQRLPLNVVAQPPAGRTLKGWYALAWLVRSDSVLAPRQMRRDLKLWQSTYPHHPANERILPQLLGALPRQAGSRQTTVPSRVALLLPHTGPLAPTGHAVALGFTLEHSGVDVTRYDTAGTPEGALDAYKRAVNNGANWVVGPLSQKSVQALAASRYGDVSQLALNELPDRGRVRSGFYQFGLGPRASARAVAQLAAGDGRHHAAILYTNTDWGARAARAFDTAFRNTGGVVVDSRPFPFHGDHLGAAVKDLLRGGRAGVLWRDKTAGKRQQAVDMILLIADPRDARLLNPLLAFYHAAKLPVYATSEVFSGRRKPSRDRDLNGIIFCTMPFLLYPQGRYASLRSAALARAPNVLHALPRLVALGADAASLMGRLGGLTGAAGARFAGATGRLGLSLGGRVMRHLPCAQFNNGEPVPLAPP